MLGLDPGIPLGTAGASPFGVAGTSPATTESPYLGTITAPYVIVPTRNARRHARRPRMPIRLHPALEDLIVAFSTTIGAWLLVNQFGWMWWG